MTFRQIDAYRAVMASGSVTAAARMLRISQPAVSRLLADLEAEIGFRLFDRQARLLVPTDQGRLYYEDVQRAFIGLDQLASAAEAIRGFQHAQLRLISIPSVASTVVTGLVKTFCALHPQVGVSLEVQASQAAVEWIVSHQADIGFASPPFETSAIRARRLREGASVCIMASRHHLARHKLITPRMLADESFVSFRAGTVYRYAVDEVFRRAKVARLLRFEARTTDAICGMVAAGLGVSVVGPFLPPLGRGELAVRAFQAKLPVELHLIWSKARPLSALAQRFIEVIDAQPEAPAG